MSKGFIRISIALSVLLLAGCGQNDKGLSPLEDKQGTLSETTQKEDILSVNIKVSKSEISEGESLIFEADNSINEDLSFVWKDEKGTILSKEEKYNRLFQETGTYTTTLTIYNHQGDKASKSVTVKVNKCAEIPIISNKVPIIKLTTSTLSPLSGQNVHFSAQGSVDHDGVIVKYEWRDKCGVLLCDGKTFNHTFYYLPQYDFNKNGTTTFVKTLIITDDKGQQTSKDITIVVRRGYEVPSIGESKAMDKLNFPLGSVTFSNGFTLDADWGLGSAATHKAGDDANTFYSLTDRGVNIKCKDDEKIIGLDICEKGKIFPFPSFAPSIIKYTLDDENVTVKEVISLKDRCGKPISGISNPLSTFTELAYDINGNEIAYDPNGVDTEAIAALSDGTFWLSEEYAPSLIHVAADGKILKRLVPKGLEQELKCANYCVRGDLPEILKLRHANRGIESLAVSLDEKTLYFIMQSPLDNPDYGKTRNVRLYQMNIENPSDIKEYNYQLDLPDTFNKDNESKTRKQSNVKISEMIVMEDGTLMILERISDTTKLYQVDLAKETPIDASQSDTLEESDDVPSVKKTKLFDTDLEHGYTSKIEGIADLGDNNYLLINDNDFGIAGADTIVKIAKIDPEKKPYKKQVVGRVVFFDSDGNFQKEVKAGILPDMVKFTHDGKKVIVANEGEPVGDEDLKDVVYDPYGSISIIDTATYEVKHIDFKEITTALVGSKIKKTAEIARDFEPEYVAISEDDKIAWVTLQENNAIAKIDLENDSLSSVFGLGFKDLSLSGNGLDYKKDDVLNIENTPAGVYGMYQPDTIVAYAVGGVNYFITANEGDDRDDYYEETVKASKLTHTGIPDIGDLRVNPDLGDADGDGDYEKLYAYGARSFSIWSEDGALIYDSGDALAQAVAAKFPEQFNTRDKKGKWKGLDERSEKKGIEPEALTIKDIGGKTFAYIGLEKQGGFFAYDITDPVNPVQVEYNNDIDYNTNAKDSDILSTIDDIGPEGMVAFTQDGKEYLAIANELSGTVSLYLLSSDGKATKQSKYYTGVYGESAAEIVDYDASSKRLFVTDASSNAVIVLDATNMSKIKTIDLSAYGTGVNSVSVHNGKIAVAVERKE